MILTDATNDYLQFIKFERGLSSRTVEQYSSWLNHYHKWLNQNGYPAPDLSTFTAPVLRRYLYALSSRGIRPRTVRSAFHPLHGLGEFLTANGALTANPVKSLVMPKKDAAQRLTISSEELEALLSAVEKQLDPRKTALSRAMLCVLIYCGLRAQEVLDLEVSHVSLENKTLLVANGKGSKSRLLYPPSECLTAISEWLILREADCRHPYLWAEDRGRRIGYEGLRRMLEEVKCIAGLRDHANIKPHSIRHAFATRMMVNNAPIKAIQSALGHSMAETTFRYLHMEEAQNKLMSEYASLPSSQQAKPQTPKQAESPKMKENPKDGAKAVLLRRRRQRSSQ